MDRLTRIAVRCAAWAVFAIMLLMLVGNPVYQVQNGYVGIETCFGKVSKASLQPGMAGKLPWCRVLQVDTRARTLNDVDIDASSSDLQELKGTATIQYRIQPAAAGEVYQTFGLEKEIEEVVLAPGLQEVAKSVTAKYTGTDLFYKRDQAQQEMTDGLAKWADEAAKARGLEHVIEVYGVQLTGSHFSQVFETALQNKGSRAQDLPRTDKERETQVTDAKAEAAKRVRAAEATANQIRWNAEAEANGMQAKMQQLKEHPELPCYMAYKKWDGHLSDVTSGQTMPFAEACAAVK